MADYKPCATPMQSSSSLSKLAGTPLPKGDVYRQIIGALQYATITRPDIAYSVNKLYQFMHYPMDIHWKALKRLLRYIQGTKHVGLFYSTTNSTQLTYYTDSV